ncbi:MAG: type 4a pilus biogenesis protein PilO [Planctomycetota bacterium]
MHKKIIIILGLMVIVCAGVDIGMYRLYKIKKLAQEVQKVQKEVENLESKVKQIPQLRSEVERLKITEETFKGKLPTEEEASIDSFSKILANYARSSGCEIIKLARRPAISTPEGESKPFATVTFEASVHGNFYETVRFLSMLENQERLVNLESFVINKYGSLIERPEYTVIPIVFSTYVWKAVSSK